MRITTVAWVILCLAVMTVATRAQQPANPRTPPAAPSQQQTKEPDAPPESSGAPNAAGPTRPGQSGILPSGDTGGALSIDLPGALSRARAYSAQFLSASTAAALAHEDRVQARAALFPTLSAFNQMIYTQGNGTPSGVFVANDGVHVYNEQAAVHAELFSVTRFAEYRRAEAAEAAARARQDVATRGLVATVVQNYYGLATAQRHLANAARGVDEAQAFADITRKQEAGGEAAHADVIKAELQVQQRRRDLMDAEANEGKARLALAVVMLPDINQRYRIVDDLGPDAPLPSLDEFQAQALNDNPEVRAAEAGLRQAGFAIRSARGVYYPSLVVDYFWGIDANVFGIRGPNDRQNLGSAVQATVNVPVWNWGANGSKVRQAEIQRRQAETELTLVQRQLLANIAGFHLEAQAAHSQLDSLRTSLDLATESLRLTVLRYKAGEATALEVADAQSTLAQSRNAYDDGLARYRVALANMQTLTGKL